MEREARLNRLEEADVKRERRMQELEELLATMKSYRCQEVPCPRSRENPIEVSDLEYAEEYLTPPVAPDSESEEGEVSSDCYGLIPRTTLRGGFAYTRLFRS